MSVHLSPNTLTSAFVALSFGLAMAAPMTKTPKQVRHFLLHAGIRAFLVSSLSVFAFSLSGCSCEKEEAAQGQQKDKPLAPLKSRTVPRSVEAELHPVEGATTPRPVVLVLANDPSYCQRSVKLLGHTAHLVCSKSGQEENHRSKASKKLQDGLAFLKKSYPSYVDSAPVSLVADPFYAAPAWKMLLAEPQFFAHSYLAGLDTDNALSSTSMAALHSKGAKLLVLQSKMSDRLSLLSRVAGRAGLKVHAVGDGPDSLSQAISLFLKADPRLGTAAAPTVQSNSPQK